LRSCVERSIRCRAQKRSVLRHCRPKWRKTAKWPVAPYGGDRHLSAEIGRGHQFDCNDVNAYIAVMATLTIRDFPEELRDKLRVQAAQGGRSMEAEARRLLAEGLARGPSSIVPSSAARDVQEWVKARLRPRAKPKNAVDEFIRDKRRELILEVVNDGLDPVVYFGAELDRICREADWSLDQVRSLAENGRRGVA
jgi:antitoxin FitA